MMEKLSMKQSSYGDFKKGQNKLEEIKKTIKAKAGIEPKSVKISNNNVIVQTNNSYEAIEIRMKLHKYLEDNNIKVV